MVDTLNDTPMGGYLTSNGVSFRVWAPEASSLQVCLFEGDIETDRLDLHKVDDGYWEGHLEGGVEGVHYGYRADGPYDPENGLWFDPNKLLVDPYARKLDRAFIYDAKLSAHRGEKVDTADLVPKAIVVADAKLNKDKVSYQAGGLIYEAHVRSFTKLHPKIPKRIRGTIAALGHPVTVEHLKKIGVSAIELMPITAWIDERHLIPLGLNNAWGYNPISYFALDPRLAPDGIGELREAVSKLHDAGICVFQDVVFNHNGESDVDGPTLSFRGLDAKSYFRTHPNEPGHLINDTGCGNSVDCSHPVVRRLILDSMRYFVEYAGIDGFRFDLGPALGREDENGGSFNPNAALIEDMLADDVLKDCTLIAEPWDIGPGGYQLGNFPERFNEWNDAYRDDVRRFWRGDANMVGKLATRICGSADIFASSENLTRSVNFIAAHDGFSLADLVAYEEKHNQANGENNRDGHNENLSWNNGTEGPTDDVEIQRKRRIDLKALLSTLFVSKGAIMLTAGDEFGRTQAGNNNAYAQDNETTWLDWKARDKQLELHVAQLSQIRQKLGLHNDASYYETNEVIWRRFDGEEMTVYDWEKANLDAFAMQIPSKNVIILFNRSNQHKTFIWEGETQTINPRTVNLISLKY